MNDLTVNARLRVRRETVIHVKRQLPLSAGKINVAVGNEVCPGDILGEGLTQVGFRTIRLAKELGVSPKHAEGYLKIKIGQTIYQGELLAEKHELLGWKKKLLLSPADGIADFYDGEKGILRLKLLPKKTKLVSGVSGIVDAIDQKNGIILIRTLASVIYGTFGSGKEREGTLHVLGSPGDLISSKQFTEQMRGQIIVGGGIIFSDALEKAVDLQVAGVVSGGIGALDYKAMTGGMLNIDKDRWSDVGITMMVTEGFGSIPIGDDIFDVLKKHEGKFATLDGNKGRLILPINDSSSMICIRKTNLPVALSKDTEEEIAAVPLRAGMRVRIIFPPALGDQGTVEAIDRSLTELPSGVMTYMVTVATRNSKLRVPYLNVEVIG